MPLINGSWVSDLLNGASQANPVFVTDLAGIAAPQSASGRAVLRTDGYTRIGDGGHGDFYWNASYSGPSGPLNIRPSGSTTGAWSRLLPPEGHIKAQWLGCKDDAATSGVLAPSTDNWAALQLALDSNQGGTLVLDVANTGGFAISQPLFLTAAINGVTRIKGANGYGLLGHPKASQLQPLGQTANPAYIGPTIVLSAKSDPTFDATHGPNMFVTNGSGFGQSFLNLSQNGSGVVLGATALTVEFFVYLPSAGMPAGNPVPLIGSIGTRYTGDALSSAFYLQINTGGPNPLLQWQITTGASMSAPGSLTFAAAGHTITRSSGSFISDGFQIGQTVTVAGSASNNGNLGALTGVSATVLTFGAGVVNEGPNSTAVQVSSSQSFGSAGSATFPTNQLVHVALCWNSSTGVAATYINGTRDTTISSIVGAIMQQWWEEVQVGVRYNLFPEVNQVLTCQTGTEFGSIRISRAAQYTGASFTPVPTSDLPIVPNTQCLYNFGPSNRSTTLTATPANPGGHPGFTVGLCNYHPEYQGLGFPSGGVPLWLPWRGGTAGSIGAFEVSDLSFFTPNTGIYMSFSQGNVVRKCLFQNCRRAIMVQDFSYQTLLDQIAFNGSNSQPGYNFGIGVFSEMVKITNISGSQGCGWTVAGGGALANTLLLENVYFDAGFFGGVFASGFYSTRLENCHIYQEGEAITQAMVLLAQPISCVIKKGAISSGGLMQAPIQIWGAKASVETPANGYGSVEIDTYLTCTNAAVPLVSFGGTKLEVPLELRGFSPDISQFADPSTAPTKWLDKAGASPMIIAAQEKAMWLYNFASNLSTLAWDVNLFFYGKWHFTDTGVHLAGTCAITIPFNMKGAERLIINDTAQTLTFVGPDAGTPISVAAHTNARITCTDSYVGTGTVAGTWIKVD